MFAGTDGVLAGQWQVTGGTAFPKVWFLQPNETPDFAPTFSSSIGYEAPGKAFLAATRNGSRVLAGGQRQDQAFTMSQDAAFFAPQSVRTLHPDWAVSSKVEGVFLERDGAQFTELTFGSITAPNPEAALWRNGSFEYLPTPDYTAGSFVHGVSGYQSSLIREGFQDVLYSVPAHLAVGEYIGGGEPYTHACSWANFYLTPQTYRFTDIHPTNFLWSRALGVGDVWVPSSVISSSVYQRVVGEGCPRNSSDAHALIWSAPSITAPSVTPKRSTGTGMRCSGCNTSP